MWLPTVLLPQLLPLTGQPVWLPTVLLPQLLPRTGQPVRLLKVLVLLTDQVVYPPKLTNMAAMPHQVALFPKNSLPHCVAPLTGQGAPLLTQLAPALQLPADSQQPPTRAKVTSGSLKSLLIDHNASEAEALWSEPFL